MSATIRYPRPQDGTSVSIAGSFNGWQPEPMQLSDNQEYFEKVIEAQADTASSTDFKFVLESGEWVLQDGLPTTANQDGVLNHQVELKSAEADASDNVDTALDAALDPDTPIERHDHVAPAEAISMPSDLGTEIINKEISRNEYPAASSRPASNSGSNIVESQRTSSEGEERPTSTGNMSHDSHLNPTAPAFNPVAQPFVPSSNTSRHLHSSSQSSHRQRSQSRSRKSHSRSSSIASQQRPRSGSSIHHEELNPTAHEFKPQFAQPTHHVPHASGYAAALKKPASPPLKDDFKKPQIPASRSSSSRPTSSDSAFTSSSPSIPGQGPSGTATSATTSYAEMAKHAAIQSNLVGSTDSTKHRAAAESSFIKEASVEDALAAGQDPILAQPVLQAGLRSAPGAVGDSILQKSTEDHRDDSELKAAISNVSKDIQEDQRTAATEPLQNAVQESTLDPMVEALKKKASAADFGQAIDKNTEHALSEDQPNRTGSSQVEADSDITGVKDAASKTTHLSDAVGVQAKEAQDVVLNMADQISSATETAKSKMGAAQDATTGKANQASDTMTEELSNAEDKASETASQVLDVAGKQLDNAQESLSKTTSQVGDVVEEKLDNTHQNVSKTASQVGDIAVEQLNNAQENVSKTASHVGDVVGEQLGDAEEVFQTIANKVNSAPEVAHTQANSMGEVVVEKVTVASNIVSDQMEQVRGTIESSVNAMKEAVLPVVDKAQASAAQSVSTIASANEAGSETEKRPAAQEESSIDQNTNDNEILENTSDTVSLTTIDTVDLSSATYDTEQIRLMEEVCILLDRDDNPIGSVSKKDAHLMTNINEGLLHRAFSLFVFDTDKKLLLQQRASEKITFPNMWTNSCCSHPLSVEGEVAADLSGSIEGVKIAARRKVEQELGIQPEDAPVESMEFLTRIHYLAPSDGQWGEHEIDYILFLQSCPALRVNPNEVKDHRWVNQQELRDMFQSNDLSYTPWFKLICETFLYQWWDNLDNLQICKDEKTIHRLGLDSALYKKIAHASDSPELDAKATAKPATVADTGNLDLISSSVRDKASDIASSISSHVETLADQVIQKKDDATTSIKSVAESCIEALIGDGPAASSATKDIDTSEPAAEDGLPVTETTVAPDFDTPSEAAATTSAHEASSKLPIDESSEPAAEDATLPLTETRDPVESEIQESFAATTNEADPSQASKAPDAVLELSPEGEAKLAAQTESSEPRADPSSANDADVSRPSTGKSIRAKQNFFLYIFKSLFGGIFNGFSSIFSKLAFWRKHPHQHTD